VHPPLLLLQWRDPRVAVRRRLPETLPSPMPTIYSTTNVNINRSTGSRLVLASLSPQFREALS
jgi:hypothetical protein